MSSLIPKKPEKKKKDSTTSKISSTTSKIESTIRRTEFKVPDFNDLIQFCLKNYKDEDGKIIDIELEQFLKHTLPRALHREEFGFERGGGGWSGAIKCFIHILHKGRKKEVW